MELHAAGILFGLAAVLFAAQCAVAPRVFVALLASFTAALVASNSWGLPELGPLAFCVAAAAATALSRPRWSILPPLAAGGCGAAWVSVLYAQGLPWLPAALGAGGAAVAALVLTARRPAFVSAEVRDEALVLVGMFALVLAVGPGIVGGWRSAVALTAEPLVAEGVAVGPWPGALAVGCVVLGGVYTVWKRR